MTQAASEEPVNTSFIPDGLCSGHIHNCLTDVVENIQNMVQQQRKFVGLPIGLENFDEFTSGLERGDVIVVAGRPQMGKTSLALGCSIHCAVEQGLPAAFFSTESSSTQLSLRAIAQIGHIDYQALRQGYMTDDSWSRLSYALGKLHQAPLYIEDKVFSIDKLWKNTEKIANAYGGKLGLLTLDNVQMFSGQPLSSDRTAEISHIVREIKRLARYFDVPVIVTSHLSRKLEERTDKRPMLSDIRDAGSIEDMVDMVAMLYRDDMYRPDSTDRNLAEIIIAKQRNGPIGTLRMLFEKEWMKFESLKTPKATAEEAGKTAAESTAPSE